MYFHFPRQMLIVCARSHLNSSLWQCSTLLQCNDQRPSTFTLGQCRGPYWTWSTSITPYCSCLSWGFFLSSRWFLLAFAGSASRKRQIHWQCSTSLFETGPLHWGFHESKANQFLHQSLARASKPQAHHKSFRLVFWQGICKEIHPQPNPRLQPTVISWLVYVAVPFQWVFLLQIFQCAPFDHCGLSHDAWILRPLWCCVACAATRGQSCCEWCPWCCCLASLP